MILFLNNIGVTNDHSELIHILHYFGLQKMEKIYNKKGFKTMI